MAFFFGLSLVHGQSVGATWASCGCFILWMALGGGVGFFVGDYKHNGVVGSLLGALLGPIGWVIVALLPRRGGAEIDRGDPLAREESTEIQAADGRSTLDGEPRSGMPGLAAGEVPPPRRPIFISILTLFFVILPLGLLGLLAIAAFDGSGNYKIGKEWVTREEFLRRGGPQIAISSSLLMLTAYAFWKERAWGRHLASGLMVLALLYTVISYGASLSCGLVEQVGMAAFMLWYFYEKQSVVSYYRHLEGRRFEKTPESEGDPAP